MEAAVDVFEDRLNKIDTTGLGASREKSEAVAVQKRLQWRLSEHRRTDLGTSDLPWDTRTHRKEGLRTIFCKEPRKNRWSRRDDGRARNATK
jgi:hypothetical protein